MIAITEGYAADIASIMPVMDDAFDPAFGECWTAAQCLSALAMPDSRMLVAKQDETVAGFGITRWVLDIEELLMIGVARRWQRKNIGSMLLEDIVNRARFAGRTSLFLEVRDGNAAHDFYRASNFRPVGRRKQYYSGANGFRADAITMTLDL